MTAQPSTPMPELSEQDQRVSITPDAIAAGYQQTLADEVQRRIMAEATVSQLLRERAELRQMVLELTPAADTEEGDGHA